MKDNMGLDIPEAGQMLLSQSLLLGLCWKVK